MIRQGAPLFIGIQFFSIHFTEAFDIFVLEINTDIYFLLMSVFSVCDACWHSGSSARGEKQ